MTRDAGWGRSLIIAIHDLGAALNEIGVDPGRVEIFLRASDLEKAAERAQFEFDAVTLQHRDLEGYSSIAHEGQICIDGMSVRARLDS